MTKFQWCAYGYLKNHLGKAKKLESGSYEVRYYKHQMYPNEIWDSNYVQIFKNRKLAEKYILTNWPDSGTINYD